MEARFLSRCFGLTGACCALLCVAFAPAWAETVLEPQGPSYGPSNICPDTAAPCYEPQTNIAFPYAAVGQIITVPTNGDTDLVSFGISVYSPIVAVPVGMVAEVYAWNGSHPTGSSLYTSPLTQLPTQYVWQTVTPIFDTGGLNLTAGGQYIIFVSVEQPLYLGTLVSGSPYSGGESVWAHSVPEPSPWTTETWSTIPGSLAGDWYGPGSSPPADLQVPFIATFTAVPEPGTWTLTLAGFVCLALIGLVARRGARLA
jgi:PEP-CTERM motif-containing protein